MLGLKNSLQKKIISMAAPLVSPTRPWQDLPDTVLHHIASFLHVNFPDLLRFGAVCRSWRCAALAASEGNPRLPRPVTLPLLTFCEPRGRGGGGGDDSVIRCFYGLPDNRVYHLRVPGESRGWRCWGSSHGWLAMVDLQARTFLVNPISGARVDLPTLTTLPHISRVTKRKRDGDALFLFDYPILGAGRKPRPLTGQELQAIVPGKLVLSSSPLEPDCIAVAIMTENIALAYTRPRADSWVHLSTQFFRYEDVVYHGDRFYAVSSKGEAVAIDFGGGRGAPRPTMELFAPELFPPGNVFGRYPNIHRMYLAVLPSGDFILVANLVHFYVGRNPHTDCLILSFADRHPNTNTADSFNIFKLVFNNQEKKWVKQDNIGDCSLFLGPNHSLSLPPSVAVGRLKPNCIYFPAKGHESYMQKPSGDGDFGIYNVADGKIDFIHSIDLPWIMPSPVWITPSRR